MSLGIKRERKLGTGTPQAKARTEVSFSGFSSCSAGVKGVAGRDARSHQGRAAAGSTKEQEEKPREESASDTGNAAPSQSVLFR